MEREAREYTEKKCPQKLDAIDMFVMDSMVYHNDGSNVLYYYNSVNTDSAGLEAFDKMKDEMQNILLQGIVNAPDLRHVRENGVTVTYIYRDKITGDVIGKFTFTKEDYE